MKWFQPARPAAVPDLSVASNADAASGPVPGGPRHVAIIMDGNGRWAKARRLPRVAGHRAGVEAIRRIVRGASSLGIETLTLYAFSSENWSRPPDEVSDLMNLLRHHLLAELEELRDNGARVRAIGNWRSLGPDLVERLERVMVETQSNSNFELVIALNYGAHNELTRAVRQIADKAAQGQLNPADITSELISANLDTAGLPPLDLLIRTSGEQRLSNFLLWQAAYAELWFTDIKWPDFDLDVLRQAAQDFACRDRRYGGR